MKLSSLQKGLVGHWTMSQDSLKGSLLADKTPYENDGTIYGATFTTDRKGQANKAMSFDGVDDYIRLENSFSDSGYITISVWVYREDSSVRTIYASDNANQWRNSISTRYWYTRIYNTSVLDSLPLPSISLNSWTHLVFVYDKDYDSKKIYKNGILSIEKSPTSHGSGNLNLYSATDNYIGKSNDGVSWIGSISDVRIYNRALSETEIKTLYDSYNPNIKMKTSLPKIKLYGGD